MSRFKKSLPFLLTIFFFLAIYLVSRNISQQAIRQLITQSGVLGPVVFVFFYWLTGLIAPISGTPFLFAGYFIFGSQVIFLVIIGSIIGFISNFWIARRFGRKIVRKFVSQESMQKVDKLAQNYGLVTLFLLRFFQGGIGDFISYAAGLTPLKFWPYLTVSILACIPGAILWYFFTQKISTPVAFTLLTLGMAGLFSLIFILGSFVIARIKKRTK